MRAAASATVACVWNMRGRDVASAIPVTIRAAGAREEAFAFDDVMNARAVLDERRQKLAQHATLALAKDPPASRDPREIGDRHGSPLAEPGDLPPDGIEVAGAHAFPADVEDGSANRDGVGHARCWRGQGATTTVAQGRREASGVRAGHTALPRPA